MPIGVLMENTTDARRPLKVRETRLAKSIARGLSQKNITPNQISIISVAFALFGAICMLLSGFFSGTVAAVLLVFTAIAIQLRLLCNLFDGMVAVEGGKSTPSGELFNDIPDRIADPLLLVSAGYAISSISWASELGWCAGLLAVMTAYIRTLSSSIGAPVDFSGPMAKQHRMAILTIACIAAAVEASTSGTQWALLLALLIVIVGSVITAVNRTVTAWRILENKDV
jgi:phosphatidylglycerophosphate synthase